jgi:hypothetical protein
MAETIGLVSGVLTIAQMVGELGVLTIKLKILWDQIDAVPRRVHGLLDEIRVLGPLLLDVDNQLKHGGIRQEIWNASYAVCTAHYCREAFEAVSSLVTDLHHEIHSSSPFMQKVKSAKIMLKENKIEFLEQRLKRALGILQMCLQCYSLWVSLTSFVLVELSCNDLTTPRAIGKASYDMNAKVLSLLQDNRTICLSAATSTNPQTVDSAGLVGETFQQRRSQNRPYPRAKTKFYKSDCFGTVSLSASSKDSFYVFTFHPPPWLAKVAWGFKACYGLQQFNIRHYNVRSKDSSIFSCIRSRDLVGILRLFGDRSASPFDRDEDGLSLLHVWD